MLRARVVDYVLRFMFYANFVFVGITARDESRVYEGNFRSNCFEKQKKM
jgi:hypothetical protein